MTCLAEISGIEIASFVVTSLIGAGALAVTYFKRVGIDIEQPLSVRLQKQFVDKHEFDQAVSRLDGEINEIHEILRKEIPEMERRITDAGDARVRRIHRRLDPLTTAIAALCARQGIRLPPEPVEET